MRATLSFLPAAAAESSQRARKLKRASRNTQFFGASGEEVVGRVGSYLQEGEGCVKEAQADPRSGHAERQGPGSPSAEVSFGRGLPPSLGRGLLGSVWRWSRGPELVLGNTLGNARHPTWFGVGVGVVG